MLSCGRVKTELFENTDITASIYDVSEHAHGPLGITQGHFDCLFSFVKVRTAEFECSSVFVWTGICSTTLLVRTRIFIYTDEKRCVFKNIRIRVDEALDNNHFLKKHMKCIDCHLSSGQIHKRETLHYCKGSFKNCKRSKCNCLESKQNIL